MKKILLILALLCAPLTFTVTQTGCAVLAPNQDALVVRAEQSVQVALEAFDAFLLWEKSNREVLRARAPQIKVAADRIRVSGPQWLTTARTLTKAYKSNRTVENKANLETSLAVLQVALTEVRGYLVTSTGD
jgi:hypothetical protein